MESNYEITRKAKIDYSFILAFYGLLFIVTISNIISYQSDTLLLTIGIALPLSNSLATFSISLLVHYCSFYQIPEDLLNLIFYISTGLSIIFSDSFVLSAFYSTDSQSSLNSMLGLIFLALLGPKKLVKDRRVYISVTYFLSLLAFIISLYGIQSRALTVFQFIILDMVVLFESQRCRTSSFTFSRSVFMAYNEHKNNTKNTPLDEVLEQIQKISEKTGEICMIADQETKPLSDYCLRNLKSVFRKLATTKNIYEVNLQIMDALDSDEKKFLEQNFCNHDTIVLQSSNEKVNLLMSENAYDAGQLSGILKQIGLEWNFDMFFVNDLSRKKCIQVCGDYITKKYDLISILKLKSENFKVYLEELSGLYLSNSYHNSAHGADVMCSFLYLLNSFEIINHLTSIELFACIIACLAHDVGHKGKTNRFLIMNQDSLAIQYNDISVLEMMHASTVFSLLAMDKCCFFAEKSSQDFQCFRKIVIDMILATDMAKHFDHLSVFKSKYSNEVYSLDFAETRLDFFKMLIKCSDVGHSSKKLELHEKWCKLIIEEFFAQGDEEKALGYPVSMFCDRENTNLSKSQTGFIRNIVLPVFNAVHVLLPSEKVLENCIRQLEYNADYWEGKLAGKNLTEELESERGMLVVPIVGFNPRRVSSPLLFA